MNSRPTSLFQSCKRYVTHDIWQYSNNDSQKRQPLKAVLRIISISASEFMRKKCPNVAASLTFYTMMSLVPILAVAFAVAKGFGLNDKLRELIQNELSAHPEVAAQLMSYAENMLNHTNAAGIAGVGVGVLLYSVWKLLSSIEGSFNDIWGIHRKRSILRGIADYMAFIFFFVLVGGITTSMPSFITAFLPDILDRLMLGEFADKAILLSLKLLSFCISWVLFTLVYIFIPNTKVRLSSALVPGILAGSALQALQWIIAGQMGIFKANPIYGSLAALPVFLVWLQFSWLILLFGAELSYAIQNLRNYACNPDLGKLSHGFRRTLALVVLAKIARAFATRQPAVREEDAALSLDIPIRLLREILDRLMAAGLISKVELGGDAEDPAYQPAMDTEILTCSFVNAALDRAGEEDLPLWNAGSRRAVKAHFERLRKAIAVLPADRSIASIGEQ